MSDLAGLAGLLNSTAPGRPITQTNPILNGSAAAPKPAPNTLGFPTWGTGAMGNTNTAPVVDPYAKWGGAANFNRYQTQIQSGLANTRTAGNEAFGGLVNNLRGGAENLVNSLRTGQRNLDSSRVNNEMGRMNGINDIIGFVRSGIQQGGAKLASMNATDSSAGTGGALARGFNASGNAKSRSVNNQAAITSNQLDMQQADINQQRDQGQIDLHRTRDNEVNRIGADLRSQLSALDQQAIGLSLPDRIAVDQEKQALIDQGMQRLQEVDAWLQSQLSGIKASSPDQIRQQAAQLRLAGTGAPNPFNTGIGDPAQQEQVGGPAIDQLPLYTTYKKNQG